MHYIVRKGRACNIAEVKTDKGEFNMDDHKKEKLVAIIVTTLLSIIVSIIACILGISPDKITDIDTQLNTATATYCYVDTPAEAITCNLMI